MSKVSEFNKFRFEGLESKVNTVRYMTMNRVNKDETKLIVRVPATIVYRTEYGFGIRLNATNVLYIKEWQCDMNVYGCEVMLNKQYFKPHEARFDRTYADSKWDSLLNWETWVKIAKSQDSRIDENGIKLCEVRWMISKKGLV